MARMSQCFRTRSRSRSLSLKINIWSMAVITDISAMVQYEWCLRDRRPWARPITSGMYLLVVLCGKNILSDVLQFTMTLQLVKKDKGLNQFSYSRERLNHVTVQGLSCHNPYWCAWPILLPEGVLISMGHDWVHGPAATYMANVACVTLYHRRPCRCE